MTKPAKCDTCRARKIRCDETRPSCNQCERKGYPCSYLQADSPQRDWIMRRDGSEGPSVRRVRRTPIGNGLYTTLSLSRTSSATSSLSSKSDRARLMNNSYEGLTSRAKRNHHHTNLEDLDSLYNATETRISISPSLTSRTTQLICDLIASLEVSDLRYTLRTYAVYFESIPRRIGANKALDASVEAFACAFMSFRTGTQQRIAMEKHGQALKALRESLYDPVKAHSSATLCAVHLMWITQLWLGDRQNSHAEGVARILNYNAVKDWKDPFDLEVMTALASLVAFESAFNPNIHLDARIVRLIPNATSTPSRSSQSASSKEGLATFQPCNYIRMLDVARCPETQLLEAESIYAQSQIDLQRLTCMMDSLKEASDSTLHLGSVSHPNLAMRVEWAYSRTQGILLLCSLTLNQYLSAANCTRKSLAAEAHTMVMDIITHARQCHKYRPVGSSHMLMCLAVALSATSDLTTKAQIQDLWDEYRKDYPSGDWFLYENAYKQKIRNLCSQGRTAEQQRLEDRILNCHVQ